MSLVEGLVRIHRLGAGEALGTDQVSQPEQLLVEARALIRDRRRAGDDARPALLEVAVAQPTVVLTAGVDDDLDRLIGHLLDERSDRRRTSFAAAGVDQHDARVGDDEAEGRVVAKVLGGTVAERTDDGVNALADLLQAQARVLVRRRRQCGEQHERRHQQSAKPLRVEHGGLLVGSG
jgi:hypothetical protein